MPKQRNRLESLLLSCLKEGFFKNLESMPELLVLGLVGVLPINLKLCRCAYMNICFSWVKI